MTTLATSQAESASEPQTIVPDVITDLAIPPMFSQLVATYGKELTKDDVQRTIAAFRDELEQLDGRYDAQLYDLEAKGPENWTKEDSVQAAEIRRFHKNIRLNVERTRKVTKNRALRTGQLIDGEANAMKDFCENRETRAEAIEKVELHRLARERQALAEKRFAELSPLTSGSGEAMPFDLGGISEEQYQMVLTGAKAAFEKRQREAEAAAEAKRIEDDRLIKEREAAVQRLERVNQLSMLGFVRDEGLRSYEFKNDDLPMFVADESIETMSGFEWKDMMERVTRDVNAIKARRLEAAAAAREERLRTEAALDKLNREKAERESAEKAEAEAKMKAEREAAMAPDKEKVDLYLKSVYNAALQMPEVSNADLKKRLERYFDSVANLTNSTAMEITKL